MGAFLTNPLIVIVGLNIEQTIFCIMNRYSIFALAMIAIVMLFIVFDDGEEEQEGIIGYAEDIHEKDTGYTFTIIDANGGSTKAFSRLPVDTSIHEFKGSYSSDGGMYFISQID